MLARCERRAVEQPEVRQARLDRQRERDRERRAMEQPEARQIEDYVSTAANNKQQNRLIQGKLGLHEPGRLTDKEGKLKDSLCLNGPVWQP